MSGSQQRRRQKKLEKHKKRRQEVRKNARAKQLPNSRADLIRSGANSPFGPVWMTELSDDEETSSTPELVQVVMSRHVRGLLLPQIVLVDRTCLGVKNAFLWPLMTELELVQRMTDVMSESGELPRCEPLAAQSVVYHALDYAASLGFSPHSDFVPQLVGPRPEELLDTPLARPERPIYVMGPGDKVAQIIMRLNEAVGPDGYSFLTPGGFDGDWDDEEGDWDDDEWDALDAEGEVLEAEGELVEGDVVEAKGEVVETDSVSQ